MLVNQTFQIAALHTEVSIWGGTNSSRSRNVGGLEKSHQRITCYNTYKNI